MADHDSHPPLHINLGGTLYRLCPTLDDLTAIEKKLSTTLLALAKKLSDGLMSLEELMVVVEHSVEAEARKLHVKELALRSGITHITEVVTSLFLHLFREPAHPVAPGQGVSKAELGEMAQKFQDK